MFAGLKAAVSSRGRAGTGANGASKSKKKGKKKHSQRTSSTKDSPGKEKDISQKNWGPLEPIRSILEPVVDIVQPLLTNQVVLGLLVGLLVTSWFGVGIPGRRNRSPLGGELRLHTADRLAAYEEMWRREDTELWDWLDERVGLDRLNSDRLAPIRKRPMEPRSAEEKLREEKMDERQVEEAIRVTEEKLKVLKGVMQKANIDDTKGRKEEL